MEQKNHPPAALAWFFWGLGALFYFTGYYHRVAPAVMTDRLMIDFGIGAAALGNLSAFYYYSYGLMQIPTGLLADRWGPRKLLATGSFVAAGGTFLFASATTLLPANLGRLMIGAAAGVGFVSLLRLSTRWFPPRFYATISGLTLFFGISGAVSAGVPLRFLIDRLGWRPVMAVMAAALLIIGAAIWMVVRDDPAQKGYRSFAPPDREDAPDRKRLAQGLGTVFRHRNSWLVPLVGSGLAGPVLTFAGLWGVPFFTTHYGMTTAGGSAVTSALLLCYAIGGTLLGALSDRIGLRKPVILASAAVALAAWIPILFVPKLPVWLLVALVILVGLTAGSVIVGFAFVKESVPPRFAGTITGVCNTGSILGPMVLQPLTGWALDLRWQGTFAGNARVYDLAAYHWGFVPIIAFSAMAVVLIGFATETHCRQAVTEEDVWPRR